MPKNMETPLADFLTISANAASVAASRESSHLGNFHIIEDVNAFPSPSDVVNASAKETGVSVAPDRKEAFDQAWREQLRRTFSDAGPGTAKELEEFETSGTSNGYQLGLQVMSLPPGQCFRVHAHPNIEFEYTMIGTLREFRWMFKQPAEELRGGGAGKTLSGPKIAATHMFEEKAVLQNQCMLNETGSVHQSFVGAAEACVILVLWSGCHANTPPSNIFNTDSRLRPNAGW
jgi:hypothetical protein